MKTGGQGVKPLGYTQLSIGAKMHKSNSVNMSFSIKNPLLFKLWRVKKKAEGNYSPDLNRTAPLFKQKVIFTKRIIP
jgi:hypothetical protein